MFYDDFDDFPVYNIVEPGQSSEYVDADHPYLIFVQTENYSQSEKDLLSKILSSVNLSLDKVKVLALEKSKELTLSYFRSLDKRTSILLFGVSPARLGLNIESSYFTFYRLNKWRILRAPDLNELASSIPAKKALWAVLKQQFS